MVSHQQRRLRWDIGKNSFLVRAMRHWNRVSREAVAALGSLEVFRARLDRAWHNLG